MFTQRRKRKFDFPLSSFIPNSFLFFSLHFPLCLNSQTNRKRRKLNQSDYPNSGASSSSTPPHEEDYEGGDEQGKGNDYEVFLSFRGEDTRRGFTDHLHAGLVDVGIHVFRDDNKLPIGEDIGLQLPCCIKQSKISIPIISENYASSKWCLDELVEMLKCRSSRGQRVFPIFYKVKPSQLRHLTGSFRDAINAHKENLDEMVVKEWEEALKEVSFMKGWESEKIDDGHEASLIRIVVKKVMCELKRLFLQDIPQQLVGVHDQAEHMSRIGAKLSGTRIIGLYGIGGIGKTTFAKVLYNKLSSQYECRSFVADIRESSNMGIGHVQKQLISDILGDSWDVPNVNEGINVIKHLFARKKVLIVLDDMDNNTQLNALVGDGSWIKAGSIVVITTRDKSVLDEARAEYMYPLDGLPFDQSLTLFNRHAFRSDSTPSGYEAISGDVVSTTGGLPLALEVIGSFLCGKKREVWKGTLEKLSVLPAQKVRERLMISYEALDCHEQQIFLDIACFFIGSSKQHLTYMWGARGFFPDISIEVLILKSLIKIDEHGNLIMHDQLRDLGRAIVHLEEPKEPQKRSRLCISKEVADVLGNKKGTSNIEGLCLDGAYLDNGECDWQISFTDKHFKELTNLTFLSMKNVNIIGDFQNLLPELTWLQWGDYVDLAVTSFHPKKLVVLDLSRSLVSEDWEGWGPLKVATELKVLNLSRCRRLSRTPDLSAFKKLEILILEKCKNLEELHPSIGDIKTLVSLNVRSCRRLKKLPAGVGRMKELRELLVNDSDIEELPISRGGLSLTELCLAWTSIKELPESIGFLKELKTLDASDCGLLTRISSSIGYLASLSLLDLSECHKLAKLPDSIGSLVSLQHLSLRGCLSLREIPTSIGKLTLLTELDLSFTAIVELPESIGNMQNLRMLDISETPAAILLGDGGIVMELRELIDAGREDLEGGPSNAGKNKRNIDKHQKLSDLRSRLLALVLLKRPMTPLANSSAMGYQTADSEHVLKRSRPCGISDQPLATAAFGSGNATVGASLGDRGAPVAAMVATNSESMADVKPRIADELGDKTQIWKLTEINEPSQCRSLRLPDDLPATRVSRLIYTNSGLAILALSSDAVHKLWKWPKRDNKSKGRDMTSVVPELWKPPCRNSMMTNDTSDTNPDVAVPCFALSKNDKYLISASGGGISLFNLLTFETMTTFMRSRPASTFQALHPRENNIIAIGMEDNSIQYNSQIDEVQTKLEGHRRIIKGFAFSTFLNVLVSSDADSQTLTTFMPSRPPAFMPSPTFLVFYPQDNNVIAIGTEESFVLIYNIRYDEVIANLKGHRKRITGLAFSNILNVLVSSGADSQLCAWSTDGWAKQASKVLLMPTKQDAALLSGTHVQFHQDQIHLLVVHETWIAIYEAPKLECLKQWVTGEASGPITHATYSCDGQSIYVSFEDGSVGVLIASTLGFSCRITPAAYIPPNPSLRVYPLVVAAHPSEPNQFALGLTDGSVYVLEPLESEGQWGTLPTAENGDGPSTTSGATSSDQPHR